MFPERPTCKRPSQECEGQLSLDDHLVVLERETIGYYRRLNQDHASVVTQLPDWVTQWSRRVFTAADAIDRGARGPLSRELPGR